MMFSRIADLWESFIGNETVYSVRCKLCSHYCIISNGEYGKCGTRFNNEGELYAVNWGMASGTAIDPIEKKPFFHFKPGAKVLSFGTPGCNFQCANCQNWSLSQAFKQDIIPLISKPYYTPERIVQEALKTNSDGIAYTYSEPTIFFEYAYDTIRFARNHSESSHLFHLFISNGYFSNELVNVIINEKLVEAINIDLKFMNQKKYKEICGASLKPVLQSIESITSLSNNIHLEITNLIIPGESDDEKSIIELCQLISSISPDIPLHFNRFYSAYLMKSKSPTPIDTLISAKETAQSYGLKYVYIGNIRNSKFQNTYCSKCNTLLIARKPSHSLNQYYIKSNNKALCPNCNEQFLLII